MGQISNQPIPRFDGSASLRVRIVSAVNEGSNRSIPYNYYYRRIK